MHAGPSSPGGGGPTVLLYDTFTGVNGTSLAAHTMDVGSGWTIGSGTWTISGNRATMASGSFSRDIVTADAGVSDYTVQCSLTFGSAFSDAGMVVRYQDAGDHIELRFSATQIKIIVISGFVETTVATGSVSTVGGQTHVLRATCTGNTIDVYVDDVFMCTADVSDFNTATRVGLKGYADAPSQSQFWDDFLVTI